MKLNHVTVIVTDLERSAQFYEALGFQIIVHTPPRYARFLVPNGDCTFSIEVTEHSRQMGREQSRLYFECADVDTQYEQLRTAGVEFTQPPTDMFYLWREARFLDPDGHDLRLYSAGDNRLNPPWRLPYGASRSDLSAA